MYNVIEIGLGSIKNVCLGNQINYYHYFFLKIDKEKKDGRITSAVLFSST